MRAQLFASGVMKWAYCAKTWPAPRRLREDVARAEALAELVPSVQLLRRLAWAADGKEAARFLHGSITSEAVKRTAAEARALAASIEEVTDGNGNN
jgi:hypothetical protein